MPDNRPKRHHSVADFYLRRFALPPKRRRGSWQVTAFNRQTGRLLTKTSTGNVMVENRLYEIEDSAPDDKSRLESWLSEQEHQWERTLTAVLERRGVEQGDIPNLQRFVAYSYTRTTAYAERIVRNAGPYFRTTGVQDMRRKGPPEWADEEWARGYWAHLDAIESGRVKLEEEPDFALRQQFPPPEGIFEGLATGWSYVIVYTSKARLLTSDVPVIARRRGTRDYGVIPEIGLANASDLWVPLDPNHGLLLTKSSGVPKWLGEVPSSQIREWNSAISFASHRWTIWRPDSLARMYVDLPHDKATN